MSDLANDMIGQDTGERYCYDEASGLFWKQSSDDEWISLREGALRRELKSLGLHDKPMAINNEVISKMDARIREIEQVHRVKFACALAGYKAGITEMNGRKVLITSSAKLPVPKKGEWPVLAALFAGLLAGRDEGIDGQTQETDQRNHLYTWLQHWLRSLYGGYPSRGLCLCIAGEPNSGKTLVSSIIRELTGGRIAKPYDYMIGRDNFNQELFEAPLQLIDDENADTRIDARRQFAAQIKKMVANNDTKLRGMHRDGIVLEASWRLVVLVNLEAERLMVMPPIDGDIQDKILMLKGYRRPEPSDLSQPWPMPMHTRNEAERRAFMETIRAEMPAFAFFLLEEYMPPPELTAGRFGCRHWQHSEILRELQQFSPHVRLWQLIHRSNVVFRKLVRRATKDTPGDDEWEDVNEWIGTCEELEVLLKGVDSKLSVDERREIPKPNWLGQQLKAAARHWGAAIVEERRSKTSRKYVLRRSPHLCW